MAEQVIPGETGLLATEPTAPALAKAIRTLIETPAFTRRAARAPPDTRPSILPARFAAALGKCDPGYVSNDT